MALFPHVEFAAISDRGRKRTNNEDSCFATLSRGVFVVADGMGGGDDGEVASRETVLGVDAFLKKYPLPDTGCWNIDSMVEGVRRYVSKKSKLIYDRTAEKHLKGCGSTFVSLLLDAANPSEAVALHAGDSRLYRIHGRKIVQITRDHSAETVGFKNKLFRGMILRAVGVEPSVDLERTPVPLEAGDHLLLCSDGLTRMVPDKKICSIVRMSGSVDQAVKALINQANEAGGIDNVTVVLLSVGELPEPVASLPLELEAEIEHGDVGCFDESSTKSTPLSISFDTLATTTSSMARAQTDEATGGLAFDAPAATRVSVESDLDMMRQRVRASSPSWRSRLVWLVLLAFLLLSGFGWIVYKYVLFNSAAHESESKMESAVHDGADRTPMDAVERERIEQKGRLEIEDRK